MSLLPRSNKLKQNLLPKILNFSALKIIASKIILGRIAFGIIFSFLILPVLFLVEPFKKIRLVLVSCLRFGSLALQLEYYSRLEQVALGGPPFFRIFISGTPVNNQLLNMYKEKIKIYEIPWLFRFLFIYGIPILKYFRFLENYHHQLTFQLSRKTKPVLTFNSDQENAGQQWLRERGIAAKDWYVCIFIRDARFLKTIYPNSFAFGSLLKNDWSYYDYRNGNINDLKLAIQYILDQGGFVIRMGYLVEDSLEFKDPRVIDYATYYRTEFLDIYLPSKCRFYLGTKGGSGEFFLIFNKPRAIINSVPVGWVPWGSYDIYQPKLVKSKKTGEIITYEKIIVEDLSRMDVKDKMEGLPLFDEQEHLEGHEMVYENNSQKDILALTREMFDRLNGTFKENKASRALQDKYYQNFSKDHYWANLNTPICQEFLLKYKKAFV